MNKWIGIGRLVSDPEGSTTQSGKEVAKFRIAVNRSYSKDGQQEADFINCVAFEKSANFVRNYLRKGVKIAVEGRIQTGSYDKDGVRHYTTDIIVERCEFCESKSSEGNYTAPAQTAEPANASPAPVFMQVDEELPF